ncbi:MAG TPA: YhjD/YihY/BrkB family envelope integrity protein [Anaeromyxobacteraceae bacterium]|nr:YhjD/YihY/BrkB family envelope integrity protein [Anaeromyxobacteraceae bacterium]
MLRAGLAAFRGDALKVRAMALTYISIFSLLPALMVAVSTVRRFADLDRVRARIHDFLIANLAVGAQTAVSRYLDRHVFGSETSGLDLLGFILLVISAVTLFGQVEHAVNEIWAVRRRRPRLQRWLTYWAGLTVGPLLAAGSIAVAASAHDRLGAPRLLGQATGLALTVAFFVVAYLLLPATRVRLWPAVVAGTVAAAAFELAKDLYAFAAAHLFRFEAIYGSIAAIFVFLLWLYLSWTIFLFGARLSFVLQHHRALLDLQEDPRGTLGRELLAARALLVVARAFREGAPAPDPGDVADRLDAPAEPVRELLERLRDAALIAEGVGGGLAPARPLAQISLADVRRVVAGLPPEVPSDAARSTIAALLARAEGAAADQLAETSLEDVCRALDAEAGAERDPSGAGAASRGSGTARIPV